MAEIFQWLPVERFGIRDRNQWLKELKYKGAETEGIIVWFRDRGADTKIFTMPVIPMKQIRSRRPG